MKKIAADRNYKSLKKAAMDLNAPGTGYIGDQFKARLRDQYDSLASLKGGIAMQAKEDPQAKGQNYLAQALSAIQSAHMEYWPGEWEF